MNITVRKVVAILISVAVLLQSIENIKEFVRIVERCPYDVDLVSGRYVIDAKSIMGIFSLDIAKPLTANIHCESCDDLIQELAPFIVKE